MPPERDWLSTLLVCAFVFVGAVMVVNGILS
jgi:hypothetical protein